MTATAAVPTQRLSSWTRLGVVFAASFLICIALIPVQIEDLAGLPAHPLLLHIPVVLIPILVVATIALMIRSDWRRRYGLALAILALVSLAATVLTVGAGEAFKSAREAAFAGLSGGGQGFSPPGGGDSGLSLHAELGEQLRLIMFVFVAAILAIVLADRIRGQGPEGRLGRLAGFLDRPGWNQAIRIGVGILAIAAVVWVVRTGHEGAKLAWGEEPGFGGGAQSQQQFQGPAGQAGGEGSNGGAPPELFGE